MLHGKISGTGKTMMGTNVLLRMGAADWFGREQAEEYSDIAALWFSAPRFRLKYLDVCKDNDARQTWIEELNRAYTLMIDDIDKLKATEGLSELIYGVLEERFTHGWRTILTANSGGRLLEDHFGEGYGPYIVRRIRDFCLCLDFDV